MEVPEHPTMEFGRGVLFGIELIMEAQTNTLREVLEEIDSVDDEKPIPAGSVKEMLRSFARSNQEIVADTAETLGNLEGYEDDPRDEGEDHE